jgi:hypothetical protein
LIRWIEKGGIVERLGPLVRVQNVEPLVGFVVRITFQDGVRKEIDLEPLLRGPIFAPMLDDPAVFQTVKVVGSTIGWDNGADIDPDVLYYDLRPAWMEMEEAVTA